MRILFISTTFPDAGSPARGTYNSALCRALSREHEVRVIAPRFFTEVFGLRRGRQRFLLPADIAQCGISVHYPTYWYTPKILQRSYGVQMWWSVRSTVQCAIREFRPDAVLSYWAHPEGEVGVRAARLADCPAAVIVGGTDVLLLPRLPGRGERVRKVLQQSDAVITVSDGLRDAVVDLGVAPDRVRTIYQGIDSSVFHTRQTRSAARRQLGLESECAQLVWVGRLVPVKALPVLIEAAVLLRNCQIAFQLHLLGDGPLRSALEHQVAQAGLRDHIRFHGAVGHDQLGDWYRAADLSVISSDSEGLPNVLRESLACGTPFVSTDVGSVREIAQPDISLLVPPRNPAALADAIRSLLNQEARDLAALYQARSWEACAMETAAWLKSLRHRERTGPAQQALALQS